MLDIGDDVMSLANDIGEVIDGGDFDAVMNALVYLIVHGGLNSGSTKEEFLGKVTQQCSDIWDVLKMADDPSTSIRHN
jgi:hypothetical protein